jgi:hypothetical protein
LLTSKLREVVDTMIRRRVNILCIQETKWKGQEAKEVEDTGFKPWYTGNTSTKNGIGIVLNKSLKDEVVDIKRQGDRVILVKLLVGDLVFNVISAYASQMGLNESVKMQFWEESDALVSSVPISEKLFIGGDLNGHVGSTRVGFEGVHGGFGYGSRNQEGEGILNFALAYDLIVANTLFRKRVSHLVTFSSGQHCSQIDFILARREDRHICLDCKVILGECVVPQHKLVVADFRFRVRLQQSKRVQVPKTKWWKLKEEAAKMSTCIRKVASEEFGVTIGGKRETKETWWWNEKVQNAIKEKKECFSRMHLDKSVDNVERYKVAKKTVKWMVSEARGQMHDGLYQRLGTKEGEKNIYRMVKSRERKTRDIIQVKCIKDMTERLLTKDEDIKNR